MKALKEINYKGELNLEVRYNVKELGLEDKETITVDIINNTYFILERLENLMNNPEESEINVICPSEENINYTKRKAAYVIVEQEDGKIAILKHNETFLIGGGIEPGENAEETIKRECFEETGYTLKNIKPFEE